MSPEPLYADIPDGWTEIVSHYDRCFELYGASPRGCDWPSGQDLETRFATQLSLLDDLPPRTRPMLLDVGCGPGLLLDYLHATGNLQRVDYRGVDLSAAMVEAARSRWPDKEFSTRNIVTDPFEPQSVDFAVMNGVLTEKLTLNKEAMVEQAQALIAAAFQSARIAIAFNVMSGHVDWERPDLFHWGFDELAAFLKRNVSRHYTFRADYGLHEFTTLVWREPRRRAPISPEMWWLR